MASEWRTLPFDQAVEVNPPVPLIRGETYPFVDMQSLNPSLRKVPPSENRQFLGNGTRFQHGDTLMARITPCLENGKIAQFYSPVAYSIGHGSTEFIVIRGKDGVSDNDFAYYLTRSDIVHKYAISQMTGTSGRQRVPVAALSHLEIKMPPLSEQRAIAHILGTLDDKIELNRRMNATLEAIARAIFKSWFVDFDPVHAKARGEQPYGMDAETAALFPASFEDSELGPIPAGWGVEPLSEFTTFVLGGDWGKSEITEKETCPALCIRGADIPDLQNAGQGNSPLRYLKRSSLDKRQLKHGDIVIEISGGSPTQLTGRAVFVSQELLARLPHPLVCSNFCRMLRFEDTETSLYFYLWLRYLYDSGVFAQYESGTTGIKNFAYTTFSGTRGAVIPSNDIMQAFTKHIESLYAARQHNSTQSESLTALRDALLPRLISGEIRVSDLAYNRQGT